MTKKLRILMVSSEAVPFARGGGLGEAVATLADALGARGHRVDVLTPYYSALLPSPAPEFAERATLELSVGGRSVSAKLLTPCDAHGPVRPLLLDIPEFFGRGGLYGEAGTDYPDNCMRFTALCRAALAAGSALKSRYDVLHAHDWPAGMAPYYLREVKAGGAGGVARCSVFTVHNIAYQGRFWALDLPILGLGPEHYTRERLEFFGSISFMKAGLISADKLTAVSQTYAREIQSEEGGRGLDGIVRARASDLTGILNGLDPARWDPATDAHLETHYTDVNGAERRGGARAFQAAMGLTLDERPLFAVAGSMSHDKGGDVVAQGAGEIVDAGGRLLVLAEREDETYRALRKAAERHAGAVVTRLGMTQALAHQVLAGADFLLVPSRVEPCNLMQLAAFRYGAVPVARRTGGARDTIIDADANPTTGNGLTWVGEGTPPMMGAVKRAVKLFEEPARYQAAQKCGAAVDVSFSAGAEKYEQVYLEALAAQALP